MEKVVIKHESKAKYWPRAVVVGDRAYFVGAAVGDDGRSVGPSFEEQLDFILGEIQGTLESLGSSMDQIIEMTFFYVNMKRDQQKVGPIFSKYFRAMPITCGIGTTELEANDPPLLIEIKGSALIPSAAPKSPST
jgi:enamine deaminase RidA (YjgF/YER057c/UK114 family)